MTRKRFKLVFFAVILFLTAALILLFSFELYLRLSETHIVRQEGDQLRPFAESDAELLVVYTPKGRRLVPNARLLIKNHRISGRDIVMETNSLGFRNEEIPETKKDDELRVLILGDSITWGSYLQAEETYVKRAEDYLRRLLKGRTVEAINAGVGDIGLKEEIAILEEKGLSLEPNIVVLSFYVNDSRPPWGFAGELGSRGWLRRHSLLAETIYKNSKLRRWVREKGEDRLAWTSAVTKLDWVTSRKAFLKFAKLARYDWGAGWEEGAREIIDRELEKLKELSRQHNFIVAVVAFPVAYQVYATFVEDTPQRALEEKVTRLGFPYLDLLPPLRNFRENERDIYYDWCHPTVKTNDFIGKIVADFLLEVIKANEKKSP